MFDARLRRWIDPPLARAGRRIAGFGIDAGQVTWAGFLLGVLACAALALRWDLVALLLFWANRLADGLDGAVARAGAPTKGGADYGGYLDIVLDFLIYSGMVLAFAIGRPEHALWAAVLIFSFVGTGSSFLAYAILAAKRGLETTARGRKSFFHAVGLAEGGETILALSLICVWPAAFPWIAGAFAALCGVTTIARIAMARAARR